VSTAPGARGADTPQLVVMKVGSSSLTDERGGIREPVVESIAAQIAAARIAGHRVVLVTSAAVAAGVAALGLAERPSDTGTLQALSAVGQSRLMHTYDVAFSGYAMVAAQVLLTPNDFFDRRQYLHARGTLHRLLELGCVPIINENDAIAVDELRFGDNDRLAALVAQSIGADRLVLLTDTSGLFTADPRVDPSATLVERVTDPSELAVSVGGPGSARGSGGMASKLTAAKMAAWSGVTAVIAGAHRPDVLRDALAEVPGVGTVFSPLDRKLSARKLWLAFAVSTDGAVEVDDGAVRALRDHGRSLLAAGVVAVRGSFDDGDPVDVVDGRGHVIARGLVGVDAATVASIVGRQTAQLPDGVSATVIHRDDLVVL
jgi:glutamate 5-kinase